MDTNKSNKITNHTEECVAILITRAGVLSFIQKIEDIEKIRDLYRGSGMGRYFLFIREDVREGVNKPSQVMDRNTHKDS